MFGELPKIFDRNFAVNYFLPVTAFIAMSYFLLRFYGLAPAFIQSLTQDFLKGAITLSLYSYFGGVLLLVLNGDLYSFLSGYGKFNPFKLFQKLEISRYQKMLTEIEKLDSEYISCINTNREFPEKSRMKRNHIMESIAVQFPDKERFILPTPFGNIVRAVEIYSRRTYGIEYVGGWSRMLTVIPADYRNLIEASKSQVDFWINIYFLSVCLLGEVIIIWHVTHLSYLLGFMILIILFASLLLIRAQSAALSWGDYVSSAFDVYRFKLLDLMGIARPKSREEEIHIWTSFSQAIVYRLPDIMPDYAPLENEPSRKKKIGSRSTKKVNRVVSR